MLKYKSDAMEAIYEDALANFEVGAITREELEEYRHTCLVSKVHSVPSKSVGATPCVDVPLSAYAAKT
jgi:DNA-binding transcriptional regulator YiaG